jgi:hypothetical protein
MTSGWRAVARVMILLGCCGRSEAASPVTPDGKATTALDVVEAGWRALLPVGAGPRSN